MCNAGGGGVLAIITDGRQKASVTFPWGWGGGGGGRERLLCDGLASHLGGRGRVV